MTQYNPRINILENLAIQQKKISEIDHQKENFNEEFRSHVIANKQTKCEY